MVRPQKSWTSLFYGSMNGPGLNTLVKRDGNKFTHNLAKFALSLYLDCILKSMFVRLLKKLGPTRYYSGTHKNHQNTNFNINLGSTTLFTHLKIILL